MLGCVYDGQSQAARSHSAGVAGLTQIPEDGGLPRVFLRPLCLVWPLCPAGRALLHCV